MRLVLPTGSKPASVLNSGDDLEFPALSKLGPSSFPSKPSTPTLPAYQSVKVTEVIEIPCDQRRHLNEDARSLGKGCEAQNRSCFAIARDTGVHMILNCSKSNALTVVISGHPNNVSDAKNKILASLRQAETVKIVVPQEYHGYLIGRGGDRLRAVQDSTLTRITVPSANSADPNTITITGPRHGVIEAEQWIKEAVAKQADQSYERLDIPKIYHPFICGPNNKRIDELRERTDTQINIPPRGVKATVITISGKRDGVLQAAAEIRSIHEQAKTYKTIPVHVKKSQHHLVTGPRGSGLAEILSETGVSVELPSDPATEELILRGRPEDLGRALSMVYERAESSVTEEISAPNRFHKVLIGKSGRALKEFLEGYERVNVEFGDGQDKIWVQGPPEEVIAVVGRLKNKIAQLETTLAMDTVRVDPKYFRHIIGRNGATILRLCEHNVQIKLPNPEKIENVPADEIIIEGDPDGVKEAKAEIQRIVQRLENEKRKDVIIEPRVQLLLCTGYKNAPPPIRAIYDSFPKVSFSWSYNQSQNEADESNPSNSVVQLRGDRQQVDAAVERLTKLVKQVLEDNFRQEIRIFADLRPHIFGRGSSKLQKLLDETKTRIQYPHPSEDSDLFTIIGREENVNQAITQLEELQKKMLNVKEVVVSIPSALTTRFVGDQAPSLRSICEQCDGVHIRFVNPRPKTARNPQDTQILMIGPSDAIEKALHLVDELNAKVAQLCAEELVSADPKFHGFLIGRHGSNIIRFRERHNVELIFPDRCESDPKLAREIRIVGSKSAVLAAKAELEALIKTVGDEVEHCVVVNPSLLREIMTYRRSFSFSELDQVRVIMPRTAAHVGDPDCSLDSEATCSIKMIGQKACIEVATRAFQSLITDIKEQVTREFPITDSHQWITLDHMRSQFRDLERSNRVFISLRRNTIDSNQLPSSDPVGLHGSLVITGRPDRVNSVFEEEIRPLLPIEEAFPLSKEFHRSLLSIPNTERERSTRFTTSQLSRVNQNSQNKESVNESSSTEPISKAAELRQRYNVSILVPSQNADSKQIILRGTPSQLAAAKTELFEWVRQCEALKADRIARSYERTLIVPTRFMQDLLTARPKIVESHGVSVRFGSHLPTDEIAGACKELADTTSDNDIGASTIDGPAVESNSAGKFHKERMCTVIIRGYQDKVSDALKDLETIVARLQSHTTESVYIPAEVHPHLIGSGRSAISKVMAEYNVRITFPNRNARQITDPNTVYVTGAENDVDKACDYLVAKANDILFRLDSENRTSRSKQYREEILLTPTNG